MDSILLSMVSDVAMPLESIPDLALVCLATNVHPLLLVFKLLGGTRRALVTETRIITQIAYILSEGIKLSIVHGRFEFPWGINELDSHGQRGSPSLYS